MRKNKAIPIAFNMSLGLIPVILCMVLIELMNPIYALAICSIIGLVYSISTYRLSQKKIFNFIAYISTGALIILTLVTIFTRNLIPREYLTFTMATMVLVCTGFVFYGQILIRKICKKIKDPVKQDLIQKSLDSSIVSARLIFIVGVILFLTIFLAHLVSNPLYPKEKYVLFNILPFVLLILVIGINQVAIYLASQVRDNEVEIPIVNEQGSVIGKRYKIEALTYKSMFINPVIRIAFIHNGMLFLCRRKPENLIDKNRVDIPLETYLEFEETLPQGVERIMKEAYPNGTEIEPRFSLKHHFKTQDTNRLIYLYIAYVHEEEQLRSEFFTEGKLWTFQQIEQNMGKNYLSREFEAEYDYLKETVNIWEQFK